VVMASNYKSDLGSWNVLDNASATKCLHIPMTDQPQISV
jgi:hypothetical protein